MNNLFAESAFFGIVLSLFTFYIGAFINKKIKSPLANPLLISMILCMLFLYVFKIDYENYSQGADHITLFLTPATVSLAIPMYKQIKILKENIVAIIAGIFSGCVACVVTVVGLTLLFGVDRIIYKSMLSKSVTTAIAIGITDEIGGVSTITIMAVCVTGITGSVIASFVFKLLKIEEPIAQGLACGNSAHAIGTSRAIELGEIQGAMSSLAIVVAGIMTVVIVPLFANII